MKIKYLGTAASEGNPNPFSFKKNNNPRLRASAIVNDDLLIDFGPDLLASCQKLEVTLENLKTLLITHSHDDHLLLHNFGLRLGAFNDNYENMPELTVVASEGILEHIGKLVFLDEARVSLRQISAFEKIFVNGYQIMAIPANHPGPFGESFLYLVRQDNNVLFYATDTGVFDDGILKRITTSIEKPLDAIVMDATLDEFNPDFKYHHCVENFISDIERMKVMGIVDDKTIVTAHHFSHQASEDVVQNRYIEQGYCVSKDGLEQII